MAYPKRKSLRLPGYDYSQNGVYFLTICTHQRQLILGTIVGAIHESPTSCQLSDCGICVQNVVEWLPNRFPNARVHHVVIMPNHIHLLIELQSPEERAIRETPLPHQRSELSKMVGFLKMNTAKAIHQTHPGLQVWQRGYHDHIVRTQKSYETIWNYIDTNPQKWEQDCFYSPKERSQHEPSNYH